MKVNSLKGNAKNKVKGIKAESKVKRTRSIYKRGVFRHTLYTRTGE